MFYLAATAVFLFATTTARNSNALLGWNCGYSLFSNVKIIQSSYLFYDEIDLTRMTDNVRGSVRYLTRDISSQRSWNRKRTHFNRDTYIWSSCMHPFFSLVLLSSNGLVLTPTDSPRLGYKGSDYCTLRWYLNTRTGLHIRCANHRCWLQRFASAVWTPRKGFSLVFTLRLFTPKASFLGGFSKISS